MIAPEPPTYSNVGPSAIQTDYWVAEEDDDEDGITRVNFQEVITDWGSKGQATVLLTNDLLLTQLSKVLDYI